jgi:hypothetical protein
MSSLQEAVAVPHVVVVPPEPLETIVGVRMEHESGSNVAIVACIATSSSAGIIGPRHRRNAYALAPAPVIVFSALECVVVELRSFYRVIIGREVVSTGIVRSFLAPHFGGGRFEIV